MKNNLVSIIWWWAPHHGYQIRHYYGRNFGTDDNLNFTLINVVVDKRNKTKDSDIFEIAWKTLAQRFHNTLSHKNFPGLQNADDRGMLFVDRTDEVKLRAMTRRMRRYLRSWFNSSAHHYNSWGCCPQRFSSLLL